jgi:hypothetical protein
MLEPTSTAGLSPAQAARVLDLTPNRIRQLCDSGVLKVTRTPLGRLLDAESVNALAAERALEREAKAQRDGR